MSRIGLNLNKPHYLYRPGQLIRRMRQLLTSYRSSEPWEKTTLPWGLPILYHPHDVIGASIFRLGLYDLCVSEALWRLLELGETALDIGANIGYMTSLMATRVGPNGRVYAFEPQPDIFRELESNVQLWNGYINSNRIVIYEVALSNQAGTGFLYTTSEFEKNRGTASLKVVDASVEANSDKRSVKLARLEDILADDISVGVMKLDVEGHEMEVLEGASRLLAKRQIRDIIFEEVEGYSASVPLYLEQAGYSLFRLNQGLSGMRIQPISPQFPQYQYDPPSCLATLQPERALTRLRRRGYAVLKRRLQ